MKIGILGTGAYGLALAKALRKNNHQITMWTKFEEERDLLNKERKNKKILPGITLEDDILITCDMKSACEKKELIVIAVPLAFFENTILAASKYIDETEYFAIATKGIEQEQGLFAHELLEKHIKTSKVAIISGPTFAIDLASDTICALTVASTSKEARSKVSKALSNSHLVIEESKDIIGVALCGGIKNVMAVATGMIEGLGQSDSTKAFLEKRALEEMLYIIESLGGDKDTLLSYAGIGDFLLTCNSRKSRNYTYGVKVGSRSEDLEVYEETTTVEGLYTLNSLYFLLQRRNIETPLITIMYNICIKCENPEQLLKTLVNVPAR